MRVSFIPAFLMASVAMVSALNLNELEALSTDTVTPGCLSAYSKDIDACPSTSEFKSARSCDDTCTEALNTQQQEVILACRQAFVSPDSLLRRLLDGGLVTTLCTGSSSSAPSTSASVTSTETKTKTAASSSGTPTFSGFLTMTITGPSTAVTSVPSELTLDGSDEPTVSMSAYDVQTTGVTSAAAVASDTASVSSSATSGNATSGGADDNGAGSVKAVWASVVVGFSVALGAAML